MAQPSHIPSNYAGREQALIKHELLEGYLEKLVMIIGAGRRSQGPVEICFVDGFAGPWGVESESLDGTSISISLRVLAKCRNALIGMCPQLTMRALYIEKDPSAFQRLKAYLEADKTSLIGTHCINGDFADVGIEILNWCGRDAFTFFFIDPKGYTDITLDVLKPLLQRPHSEFLINFMYEFVNRFVTQGEQQENMKALLGSDFVLKSGLVPKAREQLLFSTYQRKLKLLLGSSPRAPARSRAVRILDPNKNKVKYFLIYLTKHPKGIVEFLKHSEKMELVQKNVRAQLKNVKREASSGIVDLFADQPAAPVKGDSVFEAMVDQFWMDHLKSGSRKISESDFADILESQEWFESDLQMSLLRLSKAGKVINKSSVARRSKRFLHFEANETLALA
jgi:three-Cys-motif partner protein